MKTKLYKHSDNGQNEVIKTIMQHRSIRRFKDKEIPENLKQMLLKCAVRAPTTALGHFYSIIEIRDTELKKKLYEVCGKQKSMIDGSVFIFALDVRRSHLWADHLNVKQEIGGNTALIFACIDASLAAQNLSLAAESLGLGTVFIGMVGHKSYEVCKLLNLPKGVLPVFGLVVGYPAEDPAIRPRIPVDFIHHLDRYRDMRIEDIEKSIAILGTWSVKVNPVIRNQSEKRNLIKSILTGSWWAEGEVSLRNALKRQMKRI